MQLSLLLDGCPRLLAVMILYIDVQARFLICERHGAVVTSPKVRTLQPVLRFRAALAPNTAHQAHLVFFFLAFASACTHLGCLLRLILDAPLTGVRDVILGLTVSSNQNADLKCFQPLSEPSHSIAYTGSALGLAVYSACIPAAINPHSFCGGGIPSRARLTCLWPTPNQGSI